MGDLARIGEEFRKAWLPFFCRSGQREAVLEEFDAEEDGWLPFRDEISLPPLTGEVLAEVVRRKSAGAGSLDGWGRREMKVFPVPWFDGLGYPDLQGRCWCYSFGSGPIVRSSNVHRIRASARMFIWRIGVNPGFQNRRAVRVEAWCTTALGIEESLSGAVDTHVHVFAEDVFESFDTVDRGIWDRDLGCLGFACLVQACLF